MGAHQSLIYSVPICSPQTPDETPIYRHHKCPNDLLSTPEMEDIETVQDILLYTKKTNGDHPGLGKRNKEGVFEFMTYNKCIEIATDIGRGILGLDLAPSLKEFKDYSLRLVGILSKNTVECILLDMACALFGITSVPIYDTLGNQAIEFIINQTNLNTIFISQINLDLLLKYDLKKIPSLKTFVILESISESQKQQIEEKGLKYILWDDVVQAGKKSDLDYPDTTQDDIYTFSYTSGTTGNPKGVMISHGNIVSVISCLHYNDIELTEKEVHLSYLPLAHVFERLILCLCFYKAAKVGIYSGDVNKLKYDLEDLKPTAFASVPRLYNRFHELIQGDLKKLSGFKKILVERALSSKTYFLQHGSHYVHPIYDALIFKRIQVLFGGRIRLMVTGSAPISSQVIDFLKICFSCPILEGYGQTESGGCSFITAVNDPASGHVGGPLPNTEFKLVSVPELGYTVHDKDDKGINLPRGEICVRGYGICKGYYKDEEKTKEVIDEDGWLHTGDIGLLNLNGSIKIIDRKKNIFKLAQGEYIAVEKIELVYSNSESVEEIFVYGDSLQAFLIAIVKPNKKFLENVSKSKYEDAINEKECIEKVLENMNFHAKQAKLFGFEMVKKIHLISESFQTMDLLTTSYKMKRHEAKKYFQKELEMLYMPVSEKNLP